MNEKGKNAGFSEEEVNGFIELLKTEYSQMLTLASTSDKNVREMARILTDERRTRDGASSDPFNFSEMDSAEAIREKSKASLKEIREALCKLRSGTFGICENCGEPIPKERLQARLTVKKCVSCQEKEEAKERKANGGKRPVFSARPVMQV